MKLSRTGHLSRLVFERLADGETASEEVKNHIKSCDRCADTLVKIGSQGSAPLQANDIVPLTFRWKSKAFFALPIILALLIAIVIYPRDASNIKDTVLILDVVKNKRGKKLLLLGQGFMPAQEFHVIRASNTINKVWFEVPDIEGEIDTPSWVPFPAKTLRRFTIK